MYSYFYFKRQSRLPGERNVYVAVPRRPAKHINSAFCSIYHTRLLFCVLRTSAIVHVHVQRTCARIVALSMTASTNVQVSLARTFLMYGGPESGRLSPLIAP